MVARLTAPLCGVVRHRYVLGTRTWTDVTASPRHETTQSRRRQVKRRQKREGQETEKPLPVTTFTFQCISPQDTRAHLQDRTTTETHNNYRSEQPPTHNFHATQKFESFGKQKSQFCDVAHEWLSGHTASCSCCRSAFESCGVQPRAEAGPADGKRCGAGCRGSSLWVVLPFAEGVGSCKFAKAFPKRSSLTPYRWASDGAHSVSEAARRLESVVHGLRAETERAAGVRIEDEARSSAAVCESGQRRRTRHAVGDTSVG